MASFRADYVNTSDNSDQGAYITQIKKIDNLVKNKGEKRRLTFAEMGDRKRMPLYIYIQSLFNKPDSSKESIFEKGKYLNIILSYLELGILFLIFLHYFKLFKAALLTMILAFTVFLFKASYFQVEILFYFLSFMAFLFLVNFLFSRSLKTAILAGVFSALSYLTKGSAPLTLLIFIIVDTFFLLWVFFKGLRAGKKETLSKSFNVFFSGALKLTLIVGVFLLLVYPYIRFSKTAYGSYFFNANTSNYIWVDSWEDVKEGPNKLFNSYYAYSSNRILWTRTEIAKRYSLTGYLSSHDLSQILKREANGLNVLLALSFQSYGYFKYFLIYLIAVFLGLLMFRKILLKINLFPFLFILIYLISYILLYAWYVPVGRGVRFTLSLFIPVMFSLFYILEKLEKEAAKNRILTLKFKRLSLILNSLVLILLSTDFYRILTDYEYIAQRGGN